MQPGDGKQNKTVIIRASDVVSVYGVPSAWCCGDAFQSIPSSQLGTQYRVASYRPQYNSRLTNTSFVCVSAPHTATSVTLSTRSGLVRNIVLQQYESYRYDGADYEDLSGTLVQSDKPVAVISGSYSSILDGQEYAIAGGIVSQLLPVKSWGKLYYLFPFESLNSGFVYRVYSSNILTRLRFSDGSVECIQPGDFYEGSVNDDSVVAFESDNSIMVVQYLKSVSYINPDNRRGRSGNSMLIVTPVSLFSQSITFPVFLYTHPGLTKYYYIHINIHCELINGLLYDGTLISVASSGASTWSRISAADETMCCVRSSVSIGYHSVRHVNQKARLSVSVYAITGGGSAYAYPARGTSTTGKENRKIENMN